MKIVIRACTHVGCCIVLWQTEGREGVRGGMQVVGAYLSCSVDRVSAERAMMRGLRSGGYLATILHTTRSGQQPSSHFMSAKRQYTATSCRDMLQGKGQAILRQKAAAGCTGWLTSLLPQAHPFQASAGKAQAVSTMLVHHQFPGNKSGAWHMPDCKPPACGW